MQLDHYTSLHLTVRRNDRRGTRADSGGERANGVARRNWGSAAQPPLEPPGDREGGLLRGDVGQEGQAGGARLAMALGAGAKEHDADDLGG